MNTDSRAESEHPGNRPRRFPMPLALGGVLVILFVMEMFSGYSEWNAAATVQREANLAGSSNGGAMFQASVMVIASVMSLVASTSTRHRWVRAGWVALAAGALLLAVESMIGLPADVRGGYVIGLVVTAPALLFLHVRVRGDRIGRLLIGLALLLFLSNGLTEYAKRRIAGSPDNYIYNDGTGLYDFTGHAWDRLWLVSNVQEFTEIAAVICLIAVISIATERRSSETDCSPLTSQHAEETP